MKKYNPIPHEEALYNLQYEIDSTEQSILVDKLKLESLKKLQIRLSGLTPDQWAEEQKRKELNG